MDDLIRRRLNRFINFFKRNIRSYGRLTSIDGGYDVGFARVYIKSQRRRTTEALVLIVEGDIHVSVGVGPNTIIDIP